GDDGASQHHRLAMIEHRALEDRAARWVELIERLGGQRGVVDVHGRPVQAMARIWIPRGPAIASAPAPALTTAAAGVGRSSFSGAKLEPLSLLTSTCPAWL